MDDYYLNVLDWGATNLLAIALGGCVYLWDAASGNIEELCETAEGIFFLLLPCFLCSICCGD